MKIGLFAQKVNLSTHTLRYYEKRGLIKVDRDQSGQRSYNENDLAWVQFIQRLKETGMHLKDIQQYADLRYQGDSSLKERLEILHKHRSFVKEQIKKYKSKLIDKKHSVQSFTEYFLNDNSEDKGLDIRIVKTKKFKKISYIIQSIKFSLHSYFPNGNLARYLFQNTYKIIVFFIYI